MSIPSCSRCQFEKAKNASRSRRVVTLQPAPRTVEHHPGLCQRSGRAPHPESESGRTAASFWGPVTCRSSIPPRAPEIGRYDRGEASSGGHHRRRSYVVGYVSITRCISQSAKSIRTTVAGFSYRRAQALDRSTNGALRAHGPVKLVWLRNFANTDGTVAPIPGSIPGIS